MYAFVVISSVVYVLVKIVCDKNEQISICLRILVGALLINMFTNLAGLSPINTELKGFSNPPVIN